MDSACFAHQPDRPEVDWHWRSVFASTVDRELVEQVVDQCPDQEFVSAENVHRHRMSHDRYDTLEREREKQ